MKEKQGGVFLINSISKEEVKRLQEEGGGKNGAIAMAIVNILSSIEDIRIDSIGSLIVMQNGIFFEVTMGKRIFIPFDLIVNVDIDNDILEINLEKDESSKTVLFRIKKEKDLNNIYNSIMSKKNLLTSENIRSTEKSAKKESETEVSCPKCSSTQLTANQKGFGFGKAVVGSLVSLPVGLLAGGIGKNKIIITCLKCGHSWTPKK